MRQSTLPRYLFSLPGRVSFWINVVVIAILAVTAWTLKLGTKILDQPGGEAIGGILVVGHLGFGFWLMVTTVIDWKELSPGQRGAGALVGLASVANAVLIFFV